MEFNIKKRNGQFVAYDKNDPKKSYGQISIKTGKFVGNTKCLIELTEYRNKWVEDNNYPPRSINVIELKKGIISSVHSFSVLKEEDENKQSRLAEQLFLDLINKHETPDEPYTDIDEFGDNYSDTSGYELYITWGTLTCS